MFIPDPVSNNNNKRGGGKINCLTFSVAIISQKIEPTDKEL
jgi:hypothetical protein